MNREEALTVLANVCQQSKQTWQEHLKAQEALQFLAQLSEPKPEPEKKKGA